jgi:hypothetical protein
MLKSKDFWAGVLIGALLLYVYNTHIKKGPTSL